MSLVGHDKTTAWSRYHELKSAKQELVAEDTLAALWSGEFSWPYWVATLLSHPTQMGRITSVNHHTQ